jgi:hypothetical protein
MQFTRSHIIGAIGAAFFMILGALLTHNPAGAVEATTTTSTAPQRHYYLSKSGFTGGQALNHCATGYHFASFAELGDVPSLSYNSALGRTAPDAGSGPPSFTLGIGWVRSGYSANTVPTVQNVTPTNCNLWTSSSSSDSGESAETIAIESAYGNSSTLAFANTVTCNNSLGVWCIQN